MEALAASGGTLLIVAGYMIVRRFRASSCHSDSGCCQFDSPAIELAKKQTERLDDHAGQLAEILIMLRGELHQENQSDQKESEISIQKVTTTSTV